MRQRVKSHFEKKRDNISKCIKQVSWLFKTRIFKKLPNIPRIWGKQFPCGSSGWDGVEYLWNPGSFSGSRARRESEQRHKIIHVVVAAYLMFIDDSARERQLGHLPFVNLLFHGPLQAWRNVQILWDDAGDKQRSTSSCCYTATRRITATRNDYKYDAQT